MLKKTFWLGFVCAVYTSAAVAQECGKESMARLFLYEQAWNGIEQPFVLQREASHNGVAYLDFQQVYQGVSVLDGHYTVAIGSDCQVIGARGRTVPQEQLEQLHPPAPTLLETLILSAVGPVAAESTRSLAYVGYEDALRLVVPIKTGAYVIVLDAWTGEILKRQAEALLAAHGSSYAVGTPSAQRESSRYRGALASTVEAFGFAYSQDPDYSDYELVTLPRLHGDGSRLDGLYARVWSERIGQEGEPTPSVDGVDFSYLPTTIRAEYCLVDLSVCSHFDDVNAYYHIDRYAHDYWVQTMGVNIDFQVDVVTHLLGDGAFADWKRNLVKLMVGVQFMRNAAKEDDILYHEYTHIVTGNLGLEVGIESDIETFALNEAYADYFAASFTNDPRIGEWMNRCPPRRECVGPPDDEEMRRLDTDPTTWNWNNRNPAEQLKYGICTRFNEQDTKCKTSWLNFSDQYVWAMIWSGALWDVRTQLGPEITDQLVLTGILYAHGIRLTFEDALEGLILADQQLYNGQFKSLLLDTFAKRGIYRSGTQVGQETGEQPTGTALLGIYPNPTPSTTHVAYRLDRHTHVSLGIYDLTGRLVFEVKDGMQAAGEHHAKWDARGVANGVYLAVLTADGKRQTQRVVVQR